MQVFIPPTPFPPFKRPYTQTKCPSATTTPRRPLRCVVNHDLDATESSALTAAAATFILKKAAETYQRGGSRPRAFTVLESLLQLERTQKKHNYKATMENLHGQWRLIFIGDPRKKLETMYFPLRAHQTFRDGLFDNGVFFLGGWASFRVVGPMRLDRRNRMEFSVDKVTFKIGGLEWGKDGLDPLGNTLDGRHVRDLPFFTFFLLRDDLAAARGRSGGLALYARVPDDEQL